jgi:hypothetical protein
MERLRVPLIFFGPRLARAKDRWASRQERSGTHLDIVPTVLGLLDGLHLYSGMGRNLLDAGAEGGEGGLISGTYGSYLYFKDGFALRYTLRNDRSELFRLRDGDIVFRDVADSEPEAAARTEADELARGLGAEYLAVLETTGGTPYFFNLHYKDVAHTLVLGATGRFAASASAPRTGSRSPPRTGIRCGPPRRMRASP